MATRDFLNRHTPDGCANNMVQITPADDGEHLYKGFFLPVGGDVTLTPYGAADDSSITVTFPAGYHPIKIKRIWEASAVTVWGLS